MIRDILLLKISPDNQKIMNVNIRDGLNSLKDFFGEKKLVGISDLIMETISDIDMNVDISMAFESFLIQARKFLETRESKRYTR
jgi:hypothetical protein